MAELLPQIAFKGLPKTTDYNFMAIFFCVHFGQVQDYCKMYLSLTGTVLLQRRNNLSIPDYSSSYMVHDVYRTFKVAQTKKPDRKTARIIMNFPFVFQLEVHIN